jgi:mannan endo-1,4-beta-mannosidase
VARYYPDTKIGFTEYDFALPDAYPGGVAMADTLGIFIDQGVFLAAAWPRVGHDLMTQAPARYAVAAHRLYRDFDGRGGTFGDLLLTATSSDTASLSAHASLDSRTGCVHLVLLGKTLHATDNVTVTLKGAGTDFRKVRAWGFDGATPQLQELSSVESIDGNRFVYTLPRQTSVHLVIEPAPAVGGPGRE